MNKRLTTIPLYEQCKARIREMVGKGGFKTDRKITSEYDLAEEYGINEVTVNKAITALIHEGLLYRVRGKGTFVSPGKPQNGAYAKFIRVLVPEDIAHGVTSLFQTPIFMGLQSAASTKGVGVDFYGYQVKKLHVSMKSLFSNHTIKGFVLMAYERMLPQEASFLGDLRAKGVPVVMMDNYWKGIDHVCTDNAGGAYAATKEVLKKGRRRIGVITNAKITILNDRLEGMRKALREYGIPEDKRLSESTNNWTEIEIYRDAARLLKEKPDALFAMSRRAGFAAIRAIREKELAIPGDIFLYGFDLDENSAMLHDIPFVTVIQDVYRIGEAAARVLIDRIDGNIRKDKPAEIKIPFRLKIKK